MRCVCRATSRVGSMTRTCGALPGRTQSAMMVPNVTVLPVPDLACAAVRRRNAACVRAARLHYEVRSKAAQGDGCLLDGRRCGEASLAERTDERFLACRVRVRRRVADERAGRRRSAKEATLPRTSSLAASSTTSGIDARCAVGQSRD